jgi:hypothetical protein
MISLYPHQCKVLEQTKPLNRVAYYLDMGLGKTFVGSEKAVSFPNKILLICQKSKIQDWIEHFQKYYNLTVFDLTDKKQLEEYSGTVGKCVGVINYDLVFRRSYFSQITGFTMMLDESSIIQNETAKRSKFILGMKPENVILLSGTPTAGKYENLWSQLHLLGWDITKKRFWEHYVEVEWIEDSESGFKIPHVVGYKNVDRLKAKLAEHGAVFMKSDEAFELPEQIEIPVMVSTSKQYRKFMKDSLVTVKKLDANVSGWETGVEAELIGDTTLTKRLYARMLCSQYSKEKAQAFSDLIFSTNERLIVFYNFNDELALLWQIALQKTPHLSLVNGSRKDLQDYNLHDDSITFVQYQAGAMGLNLQLANRIIYYSLTDKSELFEQSKKRIHRIGQERTCFYHYLLCRNSVEMNILDTLKMRKDYTDELFKEWDESQK